MVSDESKKMGENKMSPMVATMMSNDLLTDRPNRRAVAPSLLKFAESTSGPDAPAMPDS
jgi:hypothetical protein